MSLDLEFRLQFKSGLGSSQYGIWISDKQVNVLGRLSRKLNESCKLKILEDSRLRLKIFYFLHETNVTMKREDIFKINIYRYQDAPVNRQCKKHNFGR